jgi:hypothetical protein
MSQNINLFTPALRKPRQQLTLAVVVQCLSVTLVALFGYNYYLQQQVRTVVAELAAAQKLFDAQINLTKTLKPKGVPPVTEANLDAEISGLEAEFKLTLASIEALKGGAFGNEQGFAEYLRAFSRQWISGLWLTSFNIGGGGELELRGRTLSPDLLPTFIQRLNRERVLAGRTIARLEMTRPKAEPVVDRTDGADEAARAPRFLEFSLATDSATPEKKP